jgi:TonB family protein
MVFGSTFGNWVLTIAILSGPACLHGEVPVGTAQALKAATSKPQPAYSAMAREMGKVTMDVVVDIEGAVEDVRINSGNPLLSARAVAAVRKWKFGSAGQNGEKVVFSLSFDLSPRT